MRRALVCSLLLIASLAGNGFLVTGVMAYADVHWAYEGEAGPAHWGELSPDYAVCGSGMEQSPVNIPASTPINPAGIAFHYQASAFNVVNNGHTIVANYDPGSWIMIDGERYDLLQFHFHAQSEHTIASQYAPLEVHFVHRNASGGLAVVGALINRGATNAAYAPVMAHLPAQQAAAPAVVPGVTINAADLLPADRSYYRYNGSLTTPPCSEGVKWHVLSSPLYFSDAEIAAFTSIYPNDYRPLQSLNARTFLMTGAVPGMPTTGGNAQVFLLVGVALLGTTLVGVGVLAVRRRPQS